jgi:hypothetical protein
MVRLTTKLLFLTLVLTAGCYYDVYDELYPSECKTENVSYQADILPILTGKCYQCHDAANNQGNVTLEGYDNLKFYANSGQLLGAIRHDNGFSPMPQSGGKLSDCYISLFGIWVAEGALNN